MRLEQRDGPLHREKVLATLVLPPVGPLLLALVGLVLVGRYPKFGRFLAWLGVLALFALCLPAVSNRLLYWLDSTPPLDLSQARTEQAIVIFGGGVRRAAPEYAGDTWALDPRARALRRLDRAEDAASHPCERGRRVRRHGGGGADEASSRRRVRIEGEMGGKPLAGYAHERALYSRFFSPAGRRALSFVAHSFDMPRALAELKAAGLHVTPRADGSDCSKPVRRPSGGMASEHECVARQHYALYSCPDAVRRVSRAF